VTRRTKPEVLVRLAVHDGQDCAGHIELVEARWRAITAAGEIVGIFATQREAMRALPITEVVR
jgi:hypothetical protein